MSTPPIKAFVGNAFIGNISFEGSQEQSEDSINLDDRLGNSRGFDRLGSLNQAKIEFNAGIFGRKRSANIGSLFLGLLRSVINGLSELKHSSFVVSFGKGSKKPISPVLKAASTEPDSTGNLGEPISGERRDVYIDYTLSHQNNDNRANGDRYQHEVIPPDPYDLSDVESHDDIHDEAEFSLSVESFSEFAPGGDEDDVDEATQLKQARTELAKNRELLKTLDPSTQRYADVLDEIETDEDLILTLTDD